MNPPSVLNFIVLLFLLTVAYVMFMGPISTASYIAFKDDDFQKYSDEMLLSVKSKIDNIIK